MNVRNGIDNLAQILQSQTASTPTAQKNGAQQGQAADVGSDLDHDRAQVSTAAAQVARISTGSDVRLDKVASIQSALQAGTYQVPASAVAQKVITSMLAGEK